MHGSNSEFCLRESSFDANPRKEEKNEDEDEMKAVGAAPRAQTALGR